MKAFESTNRSNLVRRETVTAGERAADIRSRISGWGNFAESNGYQVNIDQKRSRQGSPNGGRPGLGLALRSDHLVSLGNHGLPLEIWVSSSFPILFVNSCLLFPHFLISINRIFSTITEKVILTVFLVYKLVYQNKLFISSNVWKFFHLSPGTEPNPLKSHPNYDIFPLMCVQKQSTD